MELLLTRDIKTVQSTTGKLSIDGVFECFILEDRDRELTSDMPLEEIKEKKVYGNTCIPAGRYQVVITQSARFNRRLPLLVGVKGYDGIRIHPGNTALDTLGCLLPGSARSVNKVIASRLAFDKLFTKIDAALAAHESVFITIE